MTAGLIGRTDLDGTKLFTRPDNPRHRPISLDDDRSGIAYPNVFWFRWRPGGHPMDHLPRPQVANPDFVYVMTGNKWNALLHSVRYDWSNERHQERSP